MNAPVSSGRTRHKFTLDAWAAMDAAGVLPRDIELELIDGDLVEMPADGPGHKRYQLALSRLLVRSLPEPWAVSIDQTLPIAGSNGPKPDFHVYAETIHEKDLKATDVVWVIEIADTSLDFDLGVKAALYAQAGIADYWVIDVAAKAIIVHRAPQDGAYREVRTIAAAESVAPLCAPALPVRLNDLPRLD
ncbi:MAG: Uma2 family endonuclease [Hyphomonadaceae bacterium]|nr:Uma2 family endonuclease [Hyphomonadaceae bacterium]